MKFNNTISKMKVKFNNPVDYFFDFGENSFLLNDYLNKTIKFSWHNKVKCICGKIFKEFYRQSFCYNCYWNSPQASPSIFKPELSKAHLGEEDRDLEWEKKYQLQNHVVYLSVSSGLKVGVTRESDFITRWIDQGAKKAVILAKTPNRYLAGEIEYHLKTNHKIPDRTNWRKMLQNQVSDHDLLSEKEDLKTYLNQDMLEYFCNEGKVIKFNYPVLKFPLKVKSLSLSKTPLIEGRLLGLKGQYLLLDEDRVFNVRKHEGFIVDLEL